MVCGVVMVKTQYTTRATLPARLAAVRRVAPVAVLAHNSCRSRCDASAASAPCPDSRGRGDRGALGRSGWYHSLPPLGDLVAGVEMAGALPEALPGASSAPYPEALPGACPGPGIPQQARP